MLHLTLALLLSCADPAAPAPGAPPDPYAAAGGCYAVRAGERMLSFDAQGYRWTDDSTQAARFRFHPSGLGSYLLYDHEQHYLSAEEGALQRLPALQSDMTRIVDLVLDDTYVSGGEWLLLPSPRGTATFQLRSRRHDRALGAAGLVSDSYALDLELVPAEGCAIHPELSLDAEGEPATTHFADGDLYGIADAHSHIFSNYGFGGGNLFHGSAFHRLGVTHALPDCEPFHGTAGRKDFFGYAFDQVGNDSGGLVGAIPELFAGELSEDNHVTAGWPDFTDWPDARLRSTHQAQYYRWLERAWLGGLRLVVQHATSNAVICNLGVGQGVQPSRYDCEDMTAVDRIIDETWALQDYIDARHGGPGLGWFRVVATPAEARQVIGQGKLAVVLGIETSDLFDCHLTPRPGAPDCDLAWVQAQLDDYQARGVRAVFPVHKYDNRFSPGDGSGDFIELGNFLNSGHWTNQVQDCPDDGMPLSFDGGDVSVGGLLQPREDYLSPPPNDLSAFPDEPLITAAAYIEELLSDPIEGEYCQNGAFTDVGLELLDGLMSRGMIIEIDHLPAWSYRQAMALLEARDYPAAGTHGRDWDDKLAALGGIKTVGLGRCQDPHDPGGTLRELTDRAARLEQLGGYPGVPLGLDLNGFAGAPGPRFAEGACHLAQQDPIAYPFTSYDGAVQFTPPMLGNRAVDFNQEGMVHIGLLPELIEDARQDATSDAELEPLFRGAEAWIRMWEKAEARAGDLGG